MDPQRELLWLRRIRDLSHQLAEEQEVSELLPRILDAAIEITAAERGFLVRRRPRRPGGRPRIKIEVARGFDRETLQARGSVSRTIVGRVLDEEGPGVVTDEQDDLLDIASVQERRVLSILCVPLRLRGETLGVLYLDHRFQRGAFTPQDLEVLGTFAAQAALAMESAEDRARRTLDAERLGGVVQELEALKERKEAEDLPQARPEARPQGDLPGLGGLVGASPVMQLVYEQLKRAARSDAPVLIVGESGTGKELVAREHHTRGPRPGEPFLAVNCAAVHDSLLESELFGHRDGAFTGAGRGRLGLFRQAGAGTLFLDEVGDMSPALQASLLRVLQEGSVRPVAASEAVPIACRILAATHCDLAGRVQAGTFREDLYYRLDVLRLTLPPLRQRSGDLPALIEHFAREAGSGPLEVAPEAHGRLAGYAWPGNVRQVQNEVRRWLSLERSRVEVGDLSLEIGVGAQGAAPALPYEGKTLGEMEREMVLAALRACGGNKAQAARTLGIPRSTLYHLLERYKTR